jgi:MYXO-CTERM domain-containing protein
VTRRTWVRTALTITALSIATTPVARADTTEEDLAKYHRLRERLVTDFTTVGSDPGQSQPCPERNDAAGFMKWGDGTIALGHYIGVLASEHYLLTNPGRFPGADGGDPTRIDRTLDELYHALEAMERLDLVADASFPECTVAESLNGFFIRDDVPSSFSEHFPGITQIFSDFNDPILTNKEMSQDQVYHVQVGLALVVKLVPADVVVQDRALRAWAMEQAERIGRRLEDDDWNIRNPACDRPVDRGEQAQAFSPGESLAIGVMTDGAYVPAPFPGSDFLWGLLSETWNPTYDNENNLHMVLAIIAVGNGYGDDTAEVVADLADMQDWPLYPLLHRVMHGEAAVGFCETGPDVNRRAREMLDELPADGEPACPVGGAGVHGYGTHNRFIRGSDQHYAGSPGCDGLRYHGLDYMLLHNLYAIASPATWNGDPEVDPCAPLPDIVEPEPDAGPGPEPDAGADADADSDGDSDSDADSDADGDSDSDGDTDADSDADGDGDGDTDSDADSDGDGSADAGDDDDSGGCSCTAATGADGLAWTALLALAPLLRRRRRVGTR